MSVLFIGCGGQGLKILASTKEKFQHAFHATKPRVSFLGVDIGDKDCPEILSQDFVNLNSGSVLDTVTGSHWPFLEKWWWSRDYAPNWSFAQGAWQHRILGRLALYLNGANLIEALRRKIADLGGADIDFIVTASSSGGTGAGIFRDLPAIIGHIMGQSQHHIYGLLVSSDIIDNFYGLSKAQLARTQKNTLSLLVELDAIACKKGRELDFTIAGSPPERIAGPRPFSMLFLTNRHNESGNSMDTMDDYVELAATVLENLGYVHASGLFRATGGTFSGIENTFGSVTAQRGIQLKFQMNDQAQWISPFEVSRMFCSFGSFTLEFAETGARTYVRERILQKLINSALTERLSKQEESLRPVVDVIIRDFRETQNCDCLTQSAWGFYAAKADEKKVVELKGDGQTKIGNLKQGILDRVQEGEDPTKYIDNFRTQVDLISVNEAFQTQLKNHLDSMAAGFNSGIAKIVRDETLTLSDRKLQLEALSLAVLAEENEYKSQKLGWLNDNKRDHIISSIGLIRNNLTNLMNPGFVKTAFSSLGLNDLKEDKEACSETIAKQLVNVYERFVVYSATSGFILAFFTNIRAFLDQELAKLKKSIADLSDLRKGIVFSYPNSIEPVGVGRGKTDFRTRIAQCREVIDKHLVTDELVSQLTRICPAEYDTCEAIFQAIAEDESRKIINRCSLDQAFKWESEYVWNEWPLSISIKGKSSTFIGLRDCIAKAGSEEWTHFLVKLGEYYDPVILNTLFTERVGDLSVAVGRLVKARAKLALDTWRSPFYHVNSPLPPMAGSAVDHHTVYFLNDTYNPEIAAIFTDFARIELNQQFSHDAAVNANRLTFVHFSVGAPLMLIQEYSTALYEQNIEREKQIKAALRGEIFYDPDSSGLHYSDKRFVSSPDLVSHSPFVYLNPSADDILAGFKTILLMTALKIARLQDDEFTLQSHLQDARGILITAGTHLGSLACIYACLYHYFRSDLAALNIHLQSKVTTVDSLKEALGTILGLPKAMQVLGSTLPTKLQKFVDELKVSIYRCTKCGTTSGDSTKCPNCGGTTMVAE